MNTLSLNPSGPPQHEQTLTEKFSSQSVILHPAQNHGKKKCWLLTEPTIEVHLAAVQSSFTAVHTSNAEIKAKTTRPKDFEKLMGIGIPRSQRCRGIYMQMG